MSKQRVVIEYDGETSSFTKPLKTAILHQGGRMYKIVDQDDSIVRVFKADSFVVSECCKGTDTMNCACTSKSGDVTEELSNNSKKQFKKHSKKKSLDLVQTYTP